jgi:hypothetical protein
VEGEESFWGMALTGCGGGIMKKLYLVLLLSFSAENVFAVRFINDLKEELNKLQTTEFNILSKRPVNLQNNGYYKRIKEERSKFSGLSVLYRIYCKDCKRIAKERRELQKKISDGRLDIQTIDAKLQKPGSSEERPLLLIEKDAIERHIKEDLSLGDSLSIRYDEVKKMIEITKEKMKTMIQEKQQYVSRLLGY